MNKTPKLRFKEFSGDWESKKLGELGEFKKTYSFSRSVEGEGNYKHIHYGDIHMNYKGIISKDKLIPSIDIPNDDRYELIKERDIIFADASEDRRDLGKVAVVRSIAGNILSGLHTFCFRPNEFLNSEFFLNHSLNKEYLKFMYTRGNGAKVLGISKSNLAEYNFLAPSKEEQEKIASFFSLIDDKISLQGDKVEALKDYKRGMMQKIFSRELRFKGDDGRDYPEWEDTELKEMLALTIDNRGKTPPITQNGIPLLEVNSLGGIYPDFNKINKFVDEDTYNEWFRNHIKEGDLLFTTVGATGLVSLADSTKSCIAQNIVGFRFKEGYNSEFMYNLFNYREIIKRIKAIEMGAVQPSVKVTQLIKLKFLIPSFEEQIKIGSTLSNIDKKIAKEQEKLDSLNEYKKGLLQKMFI